MAQNDIDNGEEELILDAVFDDLPRQAQSIVRHLEAIDNERKSHATRPTAGGLYDQDLEVEARQNPDRAFHIHVGPAAIRRHQLRANAMGLDEDEAEAVRGLHLAESFDAYADNHHIRRLPGVPSRRDSHRDLARGEAFWMGFCDARGVSIDAEGNRTPLKGHDRMQRWERARQIDADSAEQGREFGARGRAGEPVSSYAELFRRDLSGAEGGVSEYTDEVRTLVGAIQRQDEAQFIPTRRKAPPVKRRNLDRQRVR